MDDGAEENEPIDNESNSNRLLLKRWLKYPISLGRFRNRGKWKESILLLTLKQENIDDEEFIELTSTATIGLRINRETSVRSW